MSALGTVHLLPKARNADGKKDERRDDDQPMQNGQGAWGKVRVEIKPDLNRMGHPEDEKGQHSQPERAPDGPPQPRPQGQDQADAEQNDKAHINPDKRPAFGDQTEAVQDEAERADTRRCADDQRPEPQRGGHMPGCSQNWEVVSQIGKTRHKQKDGNGNDALMQEGGGFNIKNL